VDQLHNLSMSSLSMRGPRVPGMVIGTVSNINDPENLGRIKVRLPWLGEGYETDWANIVVPMTGASMGFFFIPSVNDEVLVVFDHGDINRPFVLGSIWNTNEKPPGTSADAMDSIFRLKTKQGNQLIFDDKEKTVQILTASGHYVMLEQQKITITDKSAKNSIVIDAQGQSMQIQSGNKISIKATTIEMEATANMKIKAPMMNVEASGTLNIKSSGIANIQGTMVKIN
jgi:uncharacterized protein involved in type VI secretion and phage assembly